MESVGVGGDEVGEPQAFVVAGKVCGNGSHVAELGQVTLGLRARVGLAGADDDARACLQQTAGHHHADTPGAAGDERGFAGQVEKLSVRTELIFGHGYGFLLFNSEKNRYDGSFASGVPIGVSLVIG